MDKALIEKLQSLKQVKATDYDKAIKRFEHYFNDLNFKGTNNLLAIKNLSYFEFISLVLFLMSPRDFDNKYEAIKEHEEYLFTIKSKLQLKFLIVYFKSLELQKLIKRITGSIALINPFEINYLRKNIAEKYHFSIVLIANMTSLICHKRPNMRVSFEFLEEIDENILFSLIEDYEYLVKHDEEYLLEKGLSDLRLKELLEFLYRGYNFILKQRNNHLRNINKINARLDTLIKLLQVDGEIVDFDEILRLCPTEELKVEVLDFIIDHNNLCYKELVEELDSLKRDSDVEIQHLFMKYGYNFLEIDIQEQERIKEMNLALIEEILKWFKKYGLILDLQNFRKINYEKLKIVEVLLSVGFLNQRFVAKHLDIVFGDNKKLSLISSNIDLLNANFINMINYNNSLEILLSEDIAVNLRILKEYGLMVTRDTVAVDFLKDKRLETKIEIIIEMGLFGSTKSLDILNFSLEELYRQKVFKTLDISIDTKIDFYSHDDFYMDTNEFVSKDVRELLAGLSSKEVELPKRLEKYRISDKVLFIDGVYVSVVKLLKNLGKFEEINDLNIYYAIIYNSYYTFIELEILRGIILSQEDVLVR